jgi:hypothetical protein
MGLSKASKVEKEKEVRNSSNLGGEKRTNVAVDVLKEIKAVKNTTETTQNLSGKDKKQVKKKQKTWHRKPNQDRNGKEERTGNQFHFWMNFLRFRRRG